MGIKASFTKKYIGDYVTKRIADFEAAIILNLKKVGEEFVKNARVNADFTDRTGNLRSSIGYVILRNGEQIYSNFKGDKKEGLEKAKEVIELLKSEHRTGYVLIVVAGMQYAAAVESKGFDVISSSSILAKQDLLSAFHRLKGKVKGK